MSQKTGIEKWFETVAKKSRLKTKKVNFVDGEIDGWIFSGNELARKDGKYYKVVMVKTENGEDRYFKPMIEPFSENGVYGLLVLLKNGDKYLVQAKAESGSNTLGSVFLTTTIQTSYTNLKSGRVPYADMLKDLKNKLRGKSVPQDAGMFYHKNNRYVFAEIDDNDFKVLPNFFLATREDINILAKKGLVSEHLLQMLGLLWASKL
jgi:hypothetical protein